MQPWLLPPREGSWLTRGRIRLVASALLVAQAAALIFLFASADGFNDYKGRPLGTDFSHVYAAGSLAIEGKAASVFDWPALYARERVIFGSGTAFYGWHEPPIFLLVAGPLALLPYPLAFAAWQGITLLLYLGSIAIVLAAFRGVSWRTEALLLALAFPAVLINIGHGHDGLLIAALLATALALLHRWPAAAGVLLGLLAYRPVLAMLILLVLMAARRWRVCLAMTIAATAIAIGSALVFGAEAWSAYFAALDRSRVEMLEQGGIGWHKIQSAFGMVRMWGGDIALAYAVQGGVSLAVVAALAWLWRSDAADADKGAALTLGALLAVPYTLDFDLVALAPAIAIMAIHGMTRGFAPWQKTALACLWLMPLVVRAAAESLLVPLGVPAMLTMFGMLLWRAALSPRTA